jgi:hypothetical protein
VEEKTLVVHEGMEPVLDSHRLWAVVNLIKGNCNRSANKSNHPFQIPLLLVMEPRTRDSMYICVFMNNVVR